MGFAVPAALGVMVARPDLRPIVLVGDGAFQMTGMELSSVVRYGFQPIVIVLDNRGYGTERWLHAGDHAFNDVQPLALSQAAGTARRRHGLRGPQRRRVRPRLAAGLGRPVGLQPDSCASRPVRRQPGLGAAGEAAECEGVRRNPPLPPQEGWGEADSGLVKWDVWFGWPCRSEPSPLPRRSTVRPVRAPPCSGPHQRPANGCRSRRPRSASFPLGRGGIEQARIPSEWDGNGPPVPQSDTKVSFVNFTSVTRSSAVSAKMPMPSLQKFRLMLNYQFLKPPQFLGRETKIPCEADRLQPKLGRQIVPVNMDMRRLIRFMAVEVETVLAASQDGRHELSNSRSRFHHGSQTSHYCTAKNAHRGAIAGIAPALG